MAYGVVFYGNTATAENRSHNNVSKLTARDATSLTYYDADGNLTDDGTYQYEWDALNRLKAVKDSTGAAIVSYSYDAQNRVMSKTTADGTVTYAYQGWQVVAENKNGSLDREYTYSGQYVDDRVCMATSEGTFYYATNNQYSVAALIDDDGAVTATYNYTPYGEFTVAGDDKGNPYAFTGRRFEPETGLYDFRNRYYSAELGRFVSRDMLNEQHQPHFVFEQGELRMRAYPSLPRFVKSNFRQRVTSPLVSTMTGARQRKIGDVNKYLYAQSNPLVFCDALGLKFQMCVRTAFGIPGIEHCYLKESVPGGGSWQYSNMGVTAETNLSGSCFDLPLHICREDEFRDFLNNVMSSSYWESGITPWGDYDLLTHNCCHFVDMGLKKFNLGSTESITPWWDVLPFEQAVYDY